MTLSGRFDNRLRTKAERSMDRLNAEQRRLLAIESPSKIERWQLRQVQRKLDAARRSIHQMREGNR